jgi:23S rRNA (cytosine1962-C5)-methyltransferase
MGSASRLPRHPRRRRAPTTISGTTGASSLSERRPRSRRQAEGCSIAAAKRGVPVVAADRSALALEFTRQNAADNDVAALVTTVQAEMFGPLGGPSLDDALAGPFSCIVFDPPKLATNARERERALAAMEAVLVQLQARLVPGGLLVVCSCSAAIGRGELATLAVRTASRSGRAITQSFERGPGDDHPIQPGHDEGRYLTVMGWRVD